MASAQARWSASSHLGLSPNEEDRRRYPWGKEPDSNRANYDETGIGGTSAVGCFAAGASPYGVEEMSGNVREWCMTKWRDDYQDYQTDNDAEGDAPRVVRGGSFGDDEGGVRCAFRDRYVPYYRYHFIGFRVVVAPV